MRLVTGIMVTLGLGLIILPVAALVIRTTGQPEDTLFNLISRPVLSAVGLSLGTTLISVLVILTMGTPIAYAFARYQFPLKRLLNIAIELPIVMPPVVAGLALLMAFGRRGLLGQPLAAAGITLPFSSTAVIVAQVFVSAPFFIRAAQIQFESIPRDLEEAACIDGADSWNVFWHIALPLSLRGMLVGLVLSWARALGEFGATILFAGNLQGRTQTMPLLVYGALERDLNTALWAGLVLVAMAVVALGVVRQMTHSLNESSQTPF
jgi:molybdate transport system permease protein